jgi:two-component system, OmpR family, response regulator AdeR
MPVHNPLILVVEDEIKIVEVLEAYLRREGFQTARALDGQEALSQFRSLNPDLVLLDVQLPKMDGLEVLRHIRQQGQTAVILLTARAEDMDKLLGLRMGADDYVVKPFNPHEVIARVKAVLRRHNSASSAAKMVELGGLKMDLTSKVVWVKTERLELTLSEYRLLEHLAQSPKRTFSRAELLNACWESETVDRVVDVHLGSVRRKLEGAGLLGAIETVRGVGYRLWLE